MKLTLTQYINGVQNNSYEPERVVKHYLKMATNHDEYNAFVRIHEQYVQDNRESFAQKPLKSAPIAVKDIMLTKGYISSCGSKMLEKYVSPYSATCFKNLEKHGGLMIGKANMDEFAMG